MKTKHDAWKIYNACPNCKGSGSDPRDKTQKCLSCNGMGLVERKRENEQTNL